MSTLKSAGVFDDLARTHFKATEEQVEALARLNHEASNRSDRARQSYMQILLAGCQERLGAAREGAKRLTKADRNRQLPVIEEVQGKFYPAVLRGVTTREIADKPDLPQEERTRRALERNRRSNFARSAKSLLVGYVRAGGDLRALDVATVSKTELRRYIAAETAPHGAEELSERLTRGAEQIETTARQLAEEDKAAATEAIEQALYRLSMVLKSLGVRTTDKPEIALREGRPLRIEGGVFYPVRQEEMTQLPM